MSWFDTYAEMARSYEYDDDYYKKYGRYKKKEKKCECGLEKAGAGGKHSQWCPKYEDPFDEKEEKDDDKD